MHQQFTETHMKALSSELVQIRGTMQAAASVQLHLLKAIDKILCIGASVVLLTEQQVKLHEKFLQLPFADAKVFPAGGSLNSPELKQPNSFQADCSSSGFLEIIFTLVAIISNSLQCCKHN